MDKTSLGDRMKHNYENAYKFRLSRRMPVIMRLDGKSFHTLTRDFQKPFDLNFIGLMNISANAVCEEIQGAQIAYIQSDEISILIHNYKRLASEAWFDNEIQKMCSVASSIASVTFSMKMKEYNIQPNVLTRTMNVFDCRVFVVPEHEVCNYFIWRQQDWQRNSIQMLASSMYSQNELHKKNQNDMQEMCFQKGANWNDLSPILKRGRCIIKDNSRNGWGAENGTNGGNWTVDNDIPIFSQNRTYIDKYLEVQE